MVFKLCELLGISYFRTREEIVERSFLVRKRNRRSVWYRDQMELSIKTGYRKRVWIKRLILKHRIWTCGGADEYLANRETWPNRVANRNKRGRHWRWKRDCIYQHKRSFSFGSCERAEYLFCYGLWTFKASVELLNIVAAPIQKTRFWIENRVYWVKMSGLKSLE